MRVAVFIYKDGEKQPVRHMSKQVSNVDEIEVVLEDIEEFLDLSYDELHDEEEDEL